MSIIIFPFEPDDEVSPKNSPEVRHEDATALSEELANQSRAFKDAAQSLDRGSGESSSAAAPSGGETGNVEEWAVRSALMLSSSDAEKLVLISNSTSEHEVRWRDSDNRVLKRTWAGFFGQIPCVKDGKLNRRNATPSEYLRRMALQIDVFSSDLKLEGVTVSEALQIAIGTSNCDPSFVISQPFYDKAALPLTTEEIRGFLEEDGFKEVLKSHFGWYRAADRVVITDAKPDNFIKTSIGIVPIDLQMTIFTPEEFREAGFSDGVLITC